MVGWLRHPRRESLTGVEVDGDADRNETDDDESIEPLLPPCKGGMSGWCGQLRNRDDVRQTLFEGRLGRFDGNGPMLSPARLGSAGASRVSRRTAANPLRPARTPRTRTVHRGLNA
jgi:hypothetical protein